MAIAVEHDERRKVILRTALDVFIDEGFEGATFQKIADRCGITRTILYLYFKNKREIFTFSIKQLLFHVEENLNAIKADNSLSCTDKLINVFYIIFKLLEQNRQLLSIVLDYLLHISKGNASTSEGKDVSPEARVRRRTVKLRHILSSMVIEGIKSGELKKINVKTTNDYLYSFIESAIYQIAILKRNDFDELKEAAAFAVKQLAA